MNVRLRRRARREDGRGDAGTALLIAIFALMLVSVVAIALVVSTGTDSALAGNYRTASGAYYASVAGLEEARGRLLWKNPDYINKTNSYSNLLNSSGVPTWSLTQVMYIVNGPGVDPTSASPANYPDTEYAQEFPWGLSGAVVYQIPSVSPNSAGSLPGPSYKWVRINPITEQSLNIDVNGDGVLEGVSVLFYDPAHVNLSNNPAPSLIVPLGPSSPPVPPTPTAVQALEITAYAVMPNGSTRLLQYVVAPVIISPDANDQNFSAALTLDDGTPGNAVTFAPPTGFQINGVDGCNPPAPPGLPGAVASLGYTSSADTAYLQAQVNPTASSYPGSPLNTTPPPYTPQTPSLWNVGQGAAPVPPFTGPPLRQSWLTPASLDAVMQDIVSSADVILTGPVTGTDIWNAAPLMSAANPMTIVVNGNLTLNGSIGAGPSGYGLLLVTGILTYHPSASWDGIVLVVGQGSLVMGGHSGTGGLVGTVFVAQTRNSSGNLMPNLAASLTEQFGGADAGAGISYNSCAVKSAQGPLSYKILSFHEIPLS
jgi:hypothetical protein